MTSTTGRPDIRLSAPAKAAVTAAVVWVAVYAVLALAGQHPSELLVPGSQGSGGEVMVDDFGRDLIPDRLSHDGQQVYLIARFFPDLDAGADVVGGARFRMGRILLPALAAPGGTGTPIVVLLQLWSVVGVAAGSYGLALALRAAGRRADLGIVFAVAAATGMVALVNEPLAYGLLFLGVGLLMDGKERPALVALVLACLARETIAVFVVAVAVARYLRGRSRREALVAATILPAVAWALALRTFTPPSETPLEALAFLSLDGARTIDLLGAAACAALAAFAAWAWRRTPELLALSAVSLAWFLVFHPSSYAFESITRLSIPAVALALAAVGAWRAEQRQPAQAVPADRGR